MKKVIALFLLGLTFSSCKTADFVLPDEYVGSWSTSETPVIVRTYKFGDGFTFTRDKAIVSININKNKTASGSIGHATFENAVIKKNKVNTDLSGISYIIDCGKIGEIFTGDPLEKKEVQIWLMPANKDSLEAELRYTDGWAVFPMAGLRLVRKN